MSRSPATVLIVGASRGLGLGLAREYASRGETVIGTVRRTRPPTELHALAASSGGRVRVETVDITFPEQIAALRRRLAGATIDVLFVNAGISLGHDETVGTVPTEAFTTVMITNALSPLRVLEAFAELVPAGGILAAMSSGLASVANNTEGGMEVYRASKAALNTLLRSFAVRLGRGRAVLAMAPGWVRTDMGGANAPLDVATSARGMVDAMAPWRGRAGVAFIDYRGSTIAW